MFFKNAPREQSFWFEGSDWKMILTAFLHPPLFFFQPVITIMSFLHLQRCQKTSQGSSCYHWNEVAYLPNTALTTVSLSAPSVWSRESTRQRLPPVWWGSCPSFLLPDSCFMFVCHFRGFHGYHTHRRSERWGGQSSTGKRWTGLTHHWEGDKETSLVHYNPVQRVWIETEGIDFNWVQQCVCKNHFLNWFWLQEYLE